MHSNPSMKSFIGFSHIVSTRLSPDVLTSEISKRNWFYSFDNQMLFSHLYVTLVSLGNRILDPFWAFYCNQVINMKLFLFFYILFWLAIKDLTCLELIMKTSFWYKVKDKTQERIGSKIIVD